MRLFRHGMPFLLLSLLIFFSCSSTKSVPADEVAEIWYNLGNAYTELGRQDDAVLAYLKAQRLNPELVNAGFNLARVQIIQKKYDDSLEQLEDLLAFDPGNRLFKETMAWVFHLKGNNTAALEIYNQVLSEFSDSRNALYNSAVILVELEEYETALGRFKRLVELYADEKSAVFEIAKLEAVLDNPTESIQWLETYIAETPDDDAALELYGDMYAARKQYAEAVTAYRKIADKEIKPDSIGRVYFKIAEILLISIEDIEGGLSFLRESIGTGWKDQEYWERLLQNTDSEWIDEAQLIYQQDEETPAADESAAEAE